MDYAREKWLEALNTARTFQQPHPLANSLQERLEKTTPL
jgi:hypothetical protein